MHLALFDFEHFGKLPCPGVDWATRDSSTIGRLECPVPPERMIEESEAENQSSLTIHGHVPPIVDAPHEMNQS